MNSFLTVIERYRVRHNFNKKLGPFSKLNLIIAFVRYMREDAHYPISDSLRSELKKCDNINQMINVIEQQTKQISFPRNEGQLLKFEKQLQRIIKFARL